MPAQLQGLVASLRRGFAGFTTGQKVVTAIAVIGVVFGAYVFTSWAAKPTYAALYTDLEASDASAITDKLQSQGVSYELADGGRTVMVPRDRVYDLRLDMSSAGLPEGGSQGYALLDKQGITASEFRQRVDYQRALEGELSRTIGSIDGVDAATVHLVIPEEDLFSDDERKPTASVLLSAAPGKHLAPGQVQAIVHLVSSSVEGLQPDEVTVADDEGTMLAAPGQDGLTAVANDAQSQQRAAFEQELSQSVQHLLESVTGPGGAIVRVRADLDFDRVATHTERYEPVKGVPPATESTSTESYTGGAPAVGGVLGPDGLPVTSGAADSTYSKEQSQVTNALTTVTEEVKKAPGQVRRLSVAVLLDGNAGAIDEGAVQDLVQAATMFDASRGDEMSVTTMAFDTSAADAAKEELAQAKAASKQAELFGLARTAGILLVVVLALFLAYRSARRQRREPVLLPDMVALAGLEEVLDLDSEEDGDVAALQSPKAVAALEARRIQVREEVAELVDRQPEEVAQLLRGWLADRRRS